MRTSPAKLVVVALVAALFGLAGAASRTCGNALAHTERGSSGLERAASPGTPGAQP
jgi:hypothetical protein